MNATKRGQSPGQSQSWSLRKPRPQAGLSRLRIPLSCAGGLNQRRYNNIEQLTRPCSHLFNFCKGDPLMCGGLLLSHTACGPFVAALNRDGGVPPHPPPLLPMSMPHHPSNPEFTYPKLPSWAHPMGEGPGEVPQSDPFRQWPKHVLQAPIHVVLSPRHWGPASRHSPNPNP